MLQEYLLKNSKAASRVPNIFRGNGLRAQLLRGGAGSLLIKAVHALLAFAVAVVLARVLGPDGYGVYSFALAILMFTAVPAQIGIPQLMVRETAKAQATGDWGLMRGLWRWGNFSVLAFSILGVLAITGILLYLNTWSDESAAVVEVGIALIPLVALASVRDACLRGLRMVVWGQLPESIFRPSIFLILVGWWFVTRGSTHTLTPSNVMILYVIAAALTFVLGGLMLWTARPVGMRRRPIPRYMNSYWRNAVIPLSMIAGLQLINNYADLLLLGVFRSDEEVGIYRAVFQVALLVMFGLQAINQVIMPHFSRMYVRNEFGQLQRLMTSAVRLSLVLAIPIAGVIIFFAESVMFWIFGAAYIDGAIPLCIMAAGQLVIVSIGYGWTLLSMSGHEKLTFKALTFGAAINVVLNLALIPPLGMTGAALSTVAATIVAKLIGRQMALNVLNLESSVIGK